LEKIAICIPPEKITGWAGISVYAGSTGFDTGGRKQELQLIKGRRVRGAEDLLLIIADEIAGIIPQGDHIDIQILFLHKHGMDAVVGFVFQEPVHYPPDCLTGGRFMAVHDAFAQERFSPVGSISGNGCGVQIADDVVGIAQDNGTTILVDEAFEKLQHGMFLLFLKV
jgi:hypothetical protein